MKIEQCIINTLFYLFMFVGSIVVVGTLYGFTQYLFELLNSF